MATDKTIARIDRLMQQGKSNDEIIAALDLKSAENLWKIIQRADKAIETTTVRRRLVPRSGQEATV